MVGERDGVLLGSDDARGVLPLGVGDLPRVVGQGHGDVSNLLHTMPSVWCAAGPAALMGAFIALLACGFGLTACGADVVTPAGSDPS